MCEELKLIQTHLGIWKLEDWDILTSMIQLNNIVGIYCVKNLINGKLLIGEGNFSKRLSNHINGHSDNTIWKKDLEKYSQENFRLTWIIEEKDEIERKLIENKLQIHFDETCYNAPRKEYPTKKELLEDIGSKRYGKIVERLNNYIKVQRNYTNKCWESKMRLRDGYAGIKFKDKTQSHHILMYIVHCGDICGISSTIHHKCENKSCVNPEHLELVTNKENSRLYHNTNNKKEEISSLRSLGHSTKEIAQKLNTNIGTINRHSNNKTTSIYRGVSLTTSGKYLCQICDNKDLNLGYYKNEIEAAQNRDYYIIKNNLLGKKKATLNFHNIDYSNFIPYLQYNGQINKNLG